MKEERGASMVELALVMPMLVMLVLGIVDFSRGLTEAVVLQDAAQEGALYGSFQPADNAGIQLRTREGAVDVGNIISVTVAVAGAPCSGNTLTVTAAHDMPLLTPFVQAFFGGSSVQIARSAAYVITQPEC